MSFAAILMSALSANCQTSLELSINTSKAFEPISSDGEGVKFSYPQAVALLEDMTYCQYLNEFMIPFQDSIIGKLNAEILKYRTINRIDLKTIRELKEYNKRLRSTGNKVVHTSEVHTDLLIKSERKLKFWKNVGIASLSTLLATIIITAAAK